VKKPGCQKSSAVGHHEQTEFTNIGIHTLLKGREQFDWLRVSQHPGEKKLTVHDMGVSLVFKSHRVTTLLKKLFNPPLNQSAL
jgi:hypothetical protein